MSLDPHDLINGYLDDALSPEAQAEFANMLRECAEIRERFAQAALLHDRLRFEILAMATSSGADPPRPPQLKPRRRIWFTRMGFTAAAVVFVVIAVLRGGSVQTPAAAALAEVNRLVDANDQASDRTYRIIVEQTQPPSPSEAKRHEGRPTKPPLDGATLYARGADQFVLVRAANPGQTFITGCDGQNSWAVLPDGSIRASSDLTRFQRDVPGHEHSIPLVNIKEGLKRLRSVYDVQLLRAEADGGNESAEEPTRLLIARKKRGYSGPKRVEIVYQAETGRICEMRFVEMPYGPDRLTLRLVLIAEHDLGASFFKHSSHHSPASPFKFEE